MDEKVQWNGEKIRAMIFLEAISAVVWLFGIFFYSLPLPLSSLAQARLRMEHPAISDASTILLTVLVALFLLYLLRRVRAVGLAISILLGFLLYSTLSLFVEPLVAALLCVTLVYLSRAYRSFLTNDLLLLLGIFAGAIPFALFYAVKFLLILLGLFSAYDVFGVMFTKAIPKVAMAALAQGAPLLLLVPRSGARWLDMPSKETTAAVMGGGDVFLPLLFLTAVSVQFGIPRALACFVGALIGSAANLYVLSKVKSGIPAMPFLAAGMAAAYVLT